MGDTAFLGRPWLAGPPGASLRLIRDYGEIERLIATIDVERRPRFEVNRHSTWNQAWRGGENDSSGRGNKPLDDEQYAQFRDRTDATTTT
jgi:hypothetical protein